MPAEAVQRLLSRLASRSMLTASPLAFASRERVRNEVRAALAAALAGQGGLVLIGGQAGIGKTTLAEELVAEAAAQGALVLVGACYDLAETPPYGPWAELLATAPAAPDIPPPPNLDGRAASTTEAALFTHVRTFVASLASRQPVVVLLEDLHWADAASLDLLRTLARTVGSLPILLVATYRPEDLGRAHPLHALLPVLVREARPLRVDLRPLNEDDLHALVSARYQLPAHDLTCLTRWLQTRAEGNPFYAGELLRGLEDEGALRLIDGRWVLGDLASASLPPLLRQVIDGRIAHLGAEASRALAAAAVIGQEVSLNVWSAVLAVAEDGLLAAMEAAEAVGLVTVTDDGTAVRFTHALVREALYAGTPAVQRRLWHRRAGEELAAFTNPDPDAVAYHLQRAGDPRATDWLLRAAARAERAFAWGTAADRYATALARLSQRGAPAGERGWLSYRIAALRRYRNPHGALALLEETALLAEDAGDRVLAACTRFLRGNLHCYVGEFGPGLAELNAGTEALDLLTGEDRERLRALGAIGGFVPDTRLHRGTLVMRLAGTGRFAEAYRLGADLFDSAVEERLSDGAAGLSEANAARGVAVALAALGRPEEARRAFVRARDLFQQLGDQFHVGMTAMQEWQWVVLPYRADRQTESQRLAAAIDRAWYRAGGTPAELPRGFAQLPALLIAGHWAAARELALGVYNDGGSYKATAARALAVLARDQGDAALARHLLQEELPAGPATPVGTANFSTVLLLQRLGAWLAGEAGDLAEAREWLAAHDAWLDWSGAVLGRSEGQLAWAEYFRTAGDQSLAYRHAECALQHAAEPRQPLAALAAHRVLGELAAAAQRTAEAAAHMERALALADACAAPYERSLALLGLAEQRFAAGERSVAGGLIDEARATLETLAARPALTRADALAARVRRERPARCGYPAGLSEREVEVLRLVASGASNSEIASALTLSVRTVEKHIAHIYTKLGVRGRAEAAAYAVRHGLLPGSAGSA